MINCRWRNTHTFNLMQVNYTNTGIFTV